MVADEGFSDSEIPSEKEHQEERRRAAAWLWWKVKTAECMRLRSRGLTTKRKGRGDLKPHELMQAKERELFTPTPLSGSRKAFRPLPTRFTSTIEPPRGGFQDHKDPMAIIRPKEDTWPVLSYGRCPPSTRETPLSPERHCRLYTYPSRGNRQESPSEFLASFLLFVTIL